MLIIPVYINTNSHMFHHLCFIVQDDGSGNISFIWGGKTVFFFMLMCSARIRYSLNIFLELSPACTFIFQLSVNLVPSPWSWALGPPDNILFSLVRPHSPPEHCSSLSRRCCSQRPFSVVSYYCTHLCKTSRHTMFWLFHISQCSIGFIGDANRNDSDSGWDASSIKIYETR